MMLRFLITGIVIGFLFPSKASQVELQERLLGAWKSTSLKSSHKDPLLLFQSLSFYRNGQVALIEVHRPIHGWIKGARPSTSGYASPYKLDDEHPNQVYIVNRWFDVSFKVVGEERKHELMTLKSGDEEKWWEYTYVRLIGEQLSNSEQNAAEQPATAPQSKSK